MAGHANTTHATGTGGPAVLSEPKLMSVKEYAKLKGLSHQAVSWRIRNNCLTGGDKAQKVGSYWVIIVKQ
jgi:hypothetical protein